jgi:hypothetical protein
MKIKKYVSVMLFCLLLFGCAPITAIPPKATALPPFLNTSAPEVTLTLVPTEFKTPIPTLKPEFAKGEIYDLIWNNDANCLTPCFTGIVPDQTTLNEAVDIFAHLGLDLDHTSTKGDKDYYVASYRFDSDLSIRIRLIVIAGVVTSLDVPITLPQDEDVPIQREWKKYSPETLVAQFGTPSSVSFSSGAHVT